MARKGRQAVRNGGWPAWLLVLIGIIIGAIGMGIVNHTGHMPISRSDNAPQPAADTSQSDNGAGIAANAQQKPRYDFYSVLPEKEVVIPDAQLDAQAKAERAQTQPDTSTQAPTGATPGASPTAPQGDYLLLAGSFTTQASAETRKAQLALKGFRAHIEQVTVHGQTLHRVLLGPYNSASALEADKNKLDATGIHAIAIKEQ
ncbi:MAG TPA: SPOR domain-containing protein [Oleiagrimonas sp.]|nr:SPOR domain-containing protein [Oleiagrimonas sp.]